MQRKIMAAVAGTVLYVLLGWLFLLGPFIAGAAAGWVCRCKPKEGFFVGLLAALAGFIVLTFSASMLGLALGGFLELIVFSAFVLWNLVGFFAAGVGGLVGSSLAEPVRFTTCKKRTETRWVEEAPDIYVICPSCGHSNPEKNEFCRECKTRLLG